ncbi:hypothetical protein LCGC14_2781470, partial [marine sediment metagenome]
MKKKNLIIFLGIISLMFALVAFSATARPPSGGTHNNAGCHNSLSGAYTIATNTTGTISADNSSVIFIEITATGSNLFNIFEEIIFDKRTFKFRADNLDATGDLEFPFRSANKNDILSSKVKINTNALISSDIGTTIYLTASVCFKSKLRHLIRHKGDIFVTPSPGGIGLSKFLAIGFQVDAWNFQLSKWVVPKNIPNIPNDLDFKISVLEFP